ncbi:MAG: SDR family oxidoreductase [Proteobacteria bacterium]|nr:SDR family oxidoreductase [Pseudomonadota bacterium]
MKLSEARILLTGASGGIGSALAECLQDEGADLLLHANRHVSALHGSATVQGDLSTPEGTANVVSAAVACDINVLINNCGINQFSAFEDADIERLVSVNVTGPMVLTQKLLPHLKACPAATILNVGSTFGQIGFPGYVTYCATKHAIKGFSEALRRELADSSVTVLHVSPRATNTAMNSAQVNDLNLALGTGSDEPDYLARKIVRALATGKDRLQMGGPEKAQVKLNSLFPGIVDAVLARQLPTIRDHYTR